MVSPYTQHTLCSWVATSKWQRAELRREASIDSTWEMHGRKTRRDVDRLGDVVLFIVLFASAVDEQEVHVLESTFPEDVLHSHASPE